MQLSETTTTYRDATTREMTLLQPTPTYITTPSILNERVCAREGSKQHQILVDAANTGTQILQGLDNA